MKKESSGRFVKNFRNQHRTTVSNTFTCEERHIPDHIVSLTDPEARPIAKGKLHKKVEFGYKVLLEETKDRVMVGYSEHKGNPNYETLFEESINRFEDTMGRDKQLSLPPDSETCNASEPVERRELAFSNGVMA